MCQPTGLVDKAGVSLGLHSNLFPTNSKAATAETSFHVAAAPSAPSASTLRNPYAPARALKSARPSNDFSWPHRAHLEGPSVTHGNDQNGYLRVT